MAPKVSVIINCLNSEKYLQEAIDSVYSQTCTDWEIILWDNASTDKTAQIANSYKEKLRYYRSEVTTTLGQARNNALEKANGELIAFLDSDDIWMPEKLEKQLPLFGNPKVGIVYSDALYFNSNGYAKRQHGNKIPKQGMVWEELLKNYSITLSTAVVRRSAINTLSYCFDESFNFIEEYDLFLRLAKNWNVCYSPEMLCKYRMHEKNYSFTHTELFVKEKMVLLQKYKEIYEDFKGKNYERMAVIIMRTVAKNQWARGDSKGARSIIKEVMFKDAKSMMLYFASFVSYKIYLALRKYLSKRPFLIND
ncbi:MAG: glycosyltransferase [Nitrospinota bacterium]|nr:glycosyltransferase [Nitrospinota bacterium]